MEREREGGGRMGAGGRERRRGREREANIIDRVIVALSNGELLTR